MASHHAQGNPGPLGPGGCQHAKKLAATYPDGGPVYLSAMARVFWPDADWLSSRVNHHNGGARRGARCAGALAGRMEKAGYLRMGSDPEKPRHYIIAVDAIERASSLSSS